MEPNLPTGPNVAMSEALVRAWGSLGVRHAVIAPGSRSTPLAYACATSDIIETIVRLDERSAGFCALGIAKATGRPVLVVTTSGTAATELLPSVTEASQSHVPLIVVTTDRPPMLGGIGAPQTIRQDGLFHLVAREERYLGVPDLRDALEWPSLAAQVFAAATRPGLLGPSHLNLPFAEPLFDRAGELDPTGEARTTSASGQLASLGVSDLVSLFDGETRTIVVLAGEVGRGAGRLARYAADRGHLVFADPRAMSGVDPMTRLIGFPDQILRNREVWRQLAPERWVCVGEDFASKVLGEFQAYTVKELGAQLIRVTSWLDFYDPRRVATRIIWADVDATEIPSHVPSDRVPDAEWAARWRRYDHAVDAALCTYFGAEAPLDEPSLARGIYRSLGADDTLMVASSMPIRDVEWFGGVHPSPPRVFANRGVNGIDGTLSTFAGIVHARDSLGVGSDALDVAYLGDLAFLYDFTALFELRARRGLIVVPDNNGGAIFSFLPQRATVDGAVFERIFGTPHDLDILALCRGLGLSVAVVSTRSELEHEVSRARKDDRLHLALLASTRSGNVEVHDRLVGQAVAAMERSDR